MAGIGGPPVWMDLKLLSFGALQRERRRAGRGGCRQEGTRFGVGLFFWGGSQGNLAGRDNPGLSDATHVGVGEWRGSGVPVWMDLKPLSFGALQRERRRAGRGGCRQEETRFGVGSFLGEGSQGNLAGRGNPGLSDATHVGVEEPRSTSDARFSGSGGLRDPQRHSPDATRFGNLCEMYPEMQKEGCYGIR